MWEILQAQFIPYSSPGNPYKRETINEVKVVKPLVRVRLQHQRTCAGEETFVCRECGLSLVIVHLLLRPENPHSWKISYAFSAWEPLGRVPALLTIGQFMLGEWWVWGEPCGLSERGVKGVEWRHRGGDWNGTFSLHYFLFDLEDLHQREILWFVFQISTVILWKQDELGPLQGRTHQGDSDSWIRKTAGWPLKPVVSFYLTCPVGCHCTWKWLLGFLGPPFSFLSILQTTESLFVLYVIEALNKWASFLSQIISQYHMSWALLCVESSRLNCMCQASPSVFQSVWALREILGRVSEQKRGSSDFVAHMWYCCWSVDSAYWGWAWN